MGGDGEGLYSGDGGFGGAGPSAATAGAKEADAGGGGGGVGRIRLNGSVTGGGVASPPASTGPLPVHPLP
jgi:hypothetical protein